jgi:hypothetical protein
VLLEGLGQLKKTKYLIGNRTHDLPACSIVPQSTTLPRAPTLFFCFKNRHVGFEVLVAVFRKNPVLWDETPKIVIVVVLVFSAEQ